LVVATSNDKSDDILINVLDNANIDYYRGSLNDVLGRFYFTAKKYKPHQIVRLTGDCPVIDSQIIDDVIDYHTEGNFDYTSNVIPPTFPDGLDVEVFTFSSLQDSYNKAYLPSHREHVTPYITTNNNIFKIGNYRNDCDNSFLRWTVDEECDFELVQHFYNYLYTHRKNFSMGDILNLIEKYPKLNFINSSINRNEGLKKSLKNDINYINEK
jgi:spore coat polysaccharide biosynthesis protein SpsF